ncbi:MAG: hypothetical protein HXX16_04720 [Bacteroidales bacterium]|nr:hypothetical protein [Bacteroidales bacterium]
MNILEKQIFILKQLRELGANIQPVSTHDFQDNILMKKLKPEEIKTCLSLLEKSDFIKTESNSKFSGIYATFITDEGMEEIERYENKIRNERQLEGVQKQQTLMNKRMLYMTIILAIGASIASIYYIIQIILAFCCHCHN